MRKVEVGDVVLRMRKFVKVGVYVPYSGPKPKGQVRRIWGSGINRMIRVTCLWKEAFETWRVSEL